MIPNSINQDMLTYTLHPHLPKPKKIYYKSTSNNKLFIYALLIFIKISCK